MPDIVYPTADQLERIEHWALDSRGSLTATARAWFDFIKTAWWRSEWGWSEQTTPTQTLLHLSTGGWSGNEALISAMRQHVLWQMTWESSRRGGHHTFRIPSPPRHS